MKNIFLVLKPILKVTTFAIRHYADQFHSPRQIFGGTIFYALVDILIVPSKVRFLHSLITGVCLWVVLSSMLLIGCQQTPNDVSNLAWQGARVLAVDGKPTQYLLDCRSLASADEHYYLSVYMSKPSLDDFFEFYNDDGTLLTLVSNAELHLQRTHLGQTQSLYLVKVNFITVHLGDGRFRYEIVANDRTVEYFAQRANTELREIKKNTTFIVIDQQGSGYQVSKHPQSFYVHDRSFTCRESWGKDGAIQFRH